MLLKSLNRSASNPLVFSWAVPKNQGIYACSSSSVPKKIICVVEIIYFVEIVANTRRLLF